MRHEKFSDRLLDWFDRAGRRDLPWQCDPSPYRVWVSEIMLQQTQVQTAIAFFGRFVVRFPDVLALADAPLDEVLHLWSGLGYYARARNLHRAAQIIRDNHAGAVPEDFETLHALPGIGRSTAGAILALSHGARHAILDGNVRRVLCRHRAIDGWPGQAGVTRRLWALAESLTPHDRVAAYTQAIMDLGATLCARSRPQCGLCPVAQDCRARIGHLQHLLPTPKPRTTMPMRETVFLVLRDPQGRVLLERRPPTGIWGGLWSFPECAPGTQLDEWLQGELGLVASGVEYLPTVHHGFTHFRLEIRPILATVTEGGSGVGSIMEGPDLLWYNSASPSALGMAAPVAKLLAQLPESD